jgi:transmembrane sensor
MSILGMRDVSPPSRETVAEAAAWITRLHSSRRTPELEAAFRSWLAADAEHARAFEGMTEIWDTIPGVATPDMPRVAVWDRPRPARSWARAAAAAACAAVIVSAYWFWPNADYTTDIGEQRIVTLQDGTRVSMNAGTRMAVAYDGSQRRIVLKQGEAFFEVAHNARIPFTVIAGQHSVTAIGTAFVVRQDRNRMAVTLVEGKVRVAQVSASASEPPPPVDLSPGQRLTFGAAQLPSLDRPRVEVVTAWRRGELILDETLLGEAVAEMNRYDKTPIVIDDPRIEALPVSGIYRTGDSAGFADIVARMYELTAVREGDRIHLRHPRNDTLH